MKHFLICAVSALATLSASHVSAATLTTTSVSATANVNGNGAPEPGSPVATANKTVPVGGQFPDIVIADALQNENGFSRVEVNVKNGGFDATAASGDQTEIEAFATADRTQTYTVDGFAPVTGSFDFSVSQVMLEVFNAGGGPFIPRARVFFTAEAKIGSSTLDSYQAYMDLEGDYNSFTIIDSQGFSGTVDRQDCYQNVCQRGVVNVDPLSDSLFFGPLLPGSQVSITTSLQVEFFGVNGTELGARARAQDPNIGTFTTTPIGTTAAVPLPAGVWLMLSAFGALGLAARRKRA